MIFKTINSSVDKTRKTLALFNKDWNTYKTNWQNANGINSKIGSIFTSSNANTSVVSNEQVQILRNWNNAVAHGCTSQETFNKIIANADDNTKMYFAGLNKGKGSIEGLKNAQNVATQSTVGLTIAQTALNMAISVGLTVLIALIVKGYDELAHSAEHCKERVDELMSSYKTALDKANSNAKTIEGLIDKYKKLSKGVNNLGENISLTTDEYAEYNDIVNQIADMFPTLVQGYTDEGNAILSLKGNVEQLRDSYREAQQEAYNMLIVSGQDSDGNDIIKNWNNLDKTSFDFGDIEAGKGVSYNDAIKTLNAVKQMSYEDYWDARAATTKNLYDKLSEDQKYIHDHLSFLDDNLSQKFQDKNTYSQYQKEAKILVQTYNAEVESRLSNVETLANAYLMTNEDYAKLDEQSKNAASIIVNNLNADIASRFTTKEDVGEYVDEIVQTIISNPQAKDAMIDLFTMDTTDMSVGDIEDLVDRYINTIAKIIKEDPVELKVRLGFDDSDTQPLINNVKEKLQDEFDDKVGELTLEDLQIAAEQIEISEGTLLSWDELIAKIKEAKNASSNDDTTTLSFTDAFNSTDFADSKEKLLDLAKSGELTVSVLESTEEYNALLSQTGISAEEAKTKILDMLTSMQRLDAASQGLGNLSSAYKEFKDKGYVTATTLESLPDVFKQLDGFDLFESIAGNSTSSKKEIQKAFDDILSYYIYDQQTLKGITKEKKGIYITQLKEMGVANAKKVVNEYLTNQNAVQQMLDDYGVYISTKGEADEEYLKNLADDNTKLVDALTSTYKTDYDNWVDLLTKKGEAYNQFVKEISDSQDSMLSSPVITDEGKAQAIISNYETYGAKAGGEKQSLTSRLDPLTGSKVLGNTAHIMAKYTEDEYNKAKAYIESVEQADALKNKLSFGLGTIGTDFGGKYSGNSDSNSTTKSNTIIDWLERRTEVLSNSIDRLKSKLQNAFTVKKKNSIIDDEIKKSKKLLDTYSKEQSKYSSTASSYAKKHAKVLTKSMIQKIQSGNYDISKYDSDTANIINTYKDYWDKSKNAEKSYQDTSAGIRSLKEEKNTNKQDYADGAIAALEAQKESATTAKKKNKYLKDERKYIKDSYNAQIANAKLEKDTYLVKKLKAEKERALSENQKEQYQNRVDQADANASLLEAQNAITTDYKIQNKNLNKKAKELKTSYDYQIKIAKLTHNETEQKRLQAELEKELAGLEKQKFNNIQANYSNQIKLLDNQFTSINNKIAEIESSGQKTDASYYQSQKQLNDDIKKQYEEEKKELEAQLANIREGTDEWYEAKDAIQDCDNHISDCVKTSYELNNAINQLHFDSFNGISDSINRIIAEQEFLQELFAHEKKTDSEIGGLTEAGLTKLGSLSASYYASKNNAERDSAEVAELQRMFDSNSLHSNLLGVTFNSMDDLKKQLDTTYTKWQDDIKKTYRLETEITELMKEKYQAELDMLQELIDAKKQALNAEKDLHDYNKSITEKTSNITILQKQIAAYSGDTSQEGLAKLQKLQKELAEKEEDLRETEYDRYISDQQDMLDKLYQEYEELMAKKMDDFYGLVGEGLETSNNNTSTIADYLSLIATKNGYAIETEGLFSGKGDIKSNADKKISDIADGQSKSGTGNDSPPPPISSKTVESLRSVMAAHQPAEQQAAQKRQTELQNAQTAQFRELISKIPNLYPVTDLMGNMLPIADTLSDLGSIVPENIRNTTFGDIYYNLELPNVVDEQTFLNTIQNSKKIQKCMRSMTVDQLADAGRLAYRSIK